MNVLLQEQVAESSSVVFTLQRLTCKVDELPSIIKLATQQAQDGRQPVPEFLLAEDSLNELVGRFASTAMPSLHTKLDDFTCHLDAEFSGICCRFGAEIHLAMQTSSEQQVQQNAIHESIQQLYSGLTDTHSAIQNGLLELSLRADSAHSTQECSADSE